MPIAKRLLIRASTSYDSDDFKIVPVNGGFVEVNSAIGTIAVKVDIKNFDGSKSHLPNSFYNLNDKKHLDGTAGDAGKGDGHGAKYDPNLRLEFKFTPNKPIPGSDLVFGNDFTYAVRDYLPTTLLNTGLKFFTWFISKTVKGDVYADKPYLYGLALNSFSYISEESRDDASRDSDPELLDITKDQDFNFLEKLSVAEGSDSSIKIPDKSLDRKKYFNNVGHAKHFTFKEAVPYTFQFDTNYLKMSDSQYAVSIPTFGNKTFDIDVLKYANEKLDNFNWIMKAGGHEGVGNGDIAVILNFSLVNEEPKADTPAVAATPTEAGGQSQADAASTGTAGNAPAADPLSTNEVD